MRPLARRLALAALFLLAPSGLAAVEPAPPNDAELSQYVAIQKALATDAARAEQICAMLEEDSQRDSGRSDDLAAIGRKADTHPILGPLLRKQGMSGRRYVEVTVQIAGVLIGAAIADEADAAAGNTSNRDALVAGTPGADRILRRRPELVAALEAVQAVCEGDDGDDGEEDEGTDDGEE
jgi:hypothetical protein